jgi:diguanylate cyclase (GGDEF)-like protein
MAVWRAVLGSIRGLRFRFALLSLLAVTPFAAERLADIGSVRQGEIETAKSFMLASVQRGLDRQAAALDEARSFLTLISQLPQIRGGDAALCAHTLTPLVHTRAWAGEVTIWSTDGTVQCSTVGGGADLDRSGGRPLQAHFPTDEFTAGGIIAGRLDRDGSIVAVWPARDESGKVAFIAAAAIDPAWFIRTMSDAFAEQDPDVMLVDGAGSVIAASAATTKGRPSADDRAILLASGAKSGVVLGRSETGAAMMYGYGAVPGMAARVIVGLSAGPVIEAADRRALDDEMKLGGIVLLLLASGWGGAEMFLIRPIRALAQAAARVGHGETGARVHVPDGAGEFETVASAFNDMVDRLEREALVDGLTGLANRRHFDRHSDSEWRRAQRSGRRIAVAMIDIDHFKAYNDRYGHRIGDRVLTEIAGVIAAFARRPGDLAARIGGEEFALVLPDMEADDLAAHLRALVEAVAAKGIQHGASDIGSVTISVGALITRATRSGRLDVALRRADAALYQAKADGRNRLVLRTVRDRGDARAA